MKTRHAIQSAPVEIGKVWLPCEYVQSKKLGMQVLSLGDVEADYVDNHSARRYVRESLPDVARAFLKRMADSRKLVVLVPKDDIPQEEWPCKQVLKKDLLPELDGTAKGTQ